MHAFRSSDVSFIRTIKYTVPFVRAAKYTNSYEYTYIYSLFIRYFYLLKREFIRIAVTNATSKRISTGSLMMSRANFVRSLEDKRIVAHV